MPAGRHRAGAGRRQHHRPAAPLAPDLPRPADNPPICCALLVSRAGRVLYTNELNGFGAIDPRTGQCRDVAAAPSKAA